MTIGERIYKRRLALGLTLEDVGKATGVAKGTVGKWETGGIKSMKLDKIEKLAEILQTTPAYLMDMEAEIENRSEEELPQNIKVVPILGSVGCGKAIITEENITGFAVCSNEIDANFALRCVGDCMINARIFDNDLVFIREQSMVQDGEIAAVAVDGELQLKRVYYYRGGIELRADNPTYPVTNFGGRERDMVRIVGKAVAFLGIIK